MKLPKLSRRQKTVRNFLAAVVFLFLAWGLNSFEAPTPGLALRWKTETYGLEAPEVLYRSEWDDDRRYVVFRSKDILAEAWMYRGGGSYSVGDLTLTDISGPAALLVQSGIYPPGVPELYVWSGLPEAARAVCVLRLRNVTDVHAGEFDWDETYVMEAAPNAYGVYRFLPERKYPGGGVKGTAEEEAMYDLSSEIRSGPQADFACDVTVAFYDAVGEEIYVYEEALTEASYRPAA